MFSTEDFHKELEVRRLTGHRWIWDMSHTNTAAAAFVIPHTNVSIQQFQGKEITFIQLLQYVELHLEEFDYYELPNTGGMLLLRRNLNKHTPKWIHAYTIHVSVHIFKFCQRVVYYRRLDWNDACQCTFMNTESATVLLQLPKPAEYWDNAIFELCYYTVSLHRHILAFGHSMAYLIDAQDMNIVDQHHHKAITQFTTDQFMNLIHLPDTNRMLESCNNPESPIRLWSFENNHIQILKSFNHLRLHNIKLHIYSSLFVHRQEITDLLFHIVPVRDLCELIFEFGK